MQIVFKFRVAQGSGMCSADLLFSRVIEMPYVPPVGMEVIEGDWSATVASVVFADGVTYAFVEDDRARGERMPIEMQKLSDEYSRDGWQKSYRLLGI
jgi:hypothetical protein